MDVIRQTADWRSRKHYEIHKSDRSELELFTIFAAEGIPN